jgi:hypothetical protein
MIKSTFGNTQALDFLVGTQVGKSAFTNGIETTM